MKLTVDIVDFFPSKNKTHKGTLHIYIREIGLDIRGCRVYKRGKTIAINLPYGKEIDVETDEPVGYPYIAFTDEKLNDSIKTQLKDKGIEFLLKNYPDVFKKKEAENTPPSTLTQ